MARLLQEHYPWTTPPLIINAPMAGFATAPLAVAVTQASGLGFIGSANDMSSLSRELDAASQKLERTSRRTLPLGVGFLVFTAKIHDAIEVVGKHKPAVVWLFAAKELDEYVEWTSKMRQALPQVKIWIQTGSVTAAVTIAKTCSPDVICLQGSDAGGHGYEKGCSIISLIPEAMDALKVVGFKGAIVASGGISDGRGVAAALTLGAAGAVLGTRFLAARETIVPSEQHRQPILDKTDGGQSTQRSRIFDELRGPSIWPTEYDGRALVGDTVRDWESGVSVEEVRMRYEIAEEEGRGLERVAIWAGAGAGVGLVKRVHGAGYIVEEVRRDARVAVERVGKL
ncbi:inosine monophosphate dehydrogenase [Tothia fuscella]|uniref:Inosine monophosphate dehydrogenase n=1 Tax=Tothia fuscella TaxID=1048955 RepID=A0A9P4NNT4_9PEZI|nr:inosine monophosphate dehydrogenase [Tothia fuscella]